MAFAKISDISVDAINIPVKLFKMTVSGKTSAGMEFLRINILEKKN